MMCLNFDGDRIQHFIYYLEFRSGNIYESVKTNGYAQASKNVEMSRLRHTKTLVVASSILTLVQVIRTV